MAGPVPDRGVGCDIEEVGWGSEQLLVWSMGRNSDRGSVVTGMKGGLGRLAGGCSSFAGTEPLLELDPSKSTSGKRKA